MKLYKKLFLILTAFLTLVIIINLSFKLINDNIAILSESLTGNAPVQDKPKSSVKKHKKQYSVFDHPVEKSDFIADDDYFNDVIFIGDSITDGIKLYKAAKSSLIFAKTGLNIENIISETVLIDNEQINILEAVKKSERKKIYIMIGSNGAGWLENDYMIKLYSKWLNNLREEIPDAVIYVQSVLPITKELSDFNSSKQNALTNEKISSYNDALFEMCKKEHFYFLNVAEEFKDNENALPDEASPVDGMHLNPTYYNKWLDYIKSHIVKQ